VSAIEDVRTRAAYYSAKRARTMPIEEILADFPDPRDAHAIQQAILSAQQELTWEDEHIGKRVRIVAVIASPLTVPVLAVIWTCWLLSQAGRWILGKMITMWGRFRAW
jgi:hypothetical protein